jgi:hypothetical protein
MIKIPESLRAQIEENELRFRKQVETMRTKAVRSKQELLTTDFDSFPSDGNSDDKINFVLQFIPILPDLVLFPDKEVLDKLREMQFGKQTLKWFIPIDEILDQIERLKKVDGLFFLTHSYFTAIRDHLEMAALISMIEGFELGVNYNNRESNILHKNFAERYRRREYNEQKNQTPKMNPFESFFNSKIDQLETASKDKKVAKDMLLKTLQGDTTPYHNLLNQFYCHKISKRKVYLELFPLLKLIMKNDNLLAENEFNKEDDKYDGSYTEYQISRVKKILR